MDNTIFHQRDGSTSMLLPSAKELLLFMPRTLTHMDLDLFRPGVSAEPTENDTFPLRDLMPLVQFRQLRTLTIVGMLDSYQPCIWETVWLCPHLEVLTLEMCLEPSIRKTKSREWPTIHGDWKMQNLSEVKRGYRGYMGHGQLHHELGYGELLDSLAIGLAQKRAKREGLVGDKLSIVTLNLTSFVVDADPFVKWFDSAKLKYINFNNFCVDAGFSLPQEMLGQVTVSIPNGALPRVVLAKKYQTGSAKLITIRKGENVATNEANGPENLKGKREAERYTSSVNSEISTAARDITKGGAHKRFTHSAVFNGIKRGFEPSAYSALKGLASKVEAVLRKRALEARVKTEVERLERRQEGQDCI